MLVERSGAAPVNSVETSSVEEEKREIVETCVQANKFFKGVMNRYPDNEKVVEWAKSAHQELRGTLRDRLHSVSSRIPNNLG